MIFLKRHIVAVIVMLISSVTSFVAAEEAGTDCVFSLSAIELKANDGVIRITGDLCGQPHTSMRIDSVTMNEGVRSSDAVDIDGVDFERWFQWEDDGIIKLEIDFPAKKVKRVAKKFTLVFHTDKGDKTFDVQ